MVEWCGCFSLCAGWLLLEVRGNWIKQRRYWFVLSQDSLDYYSGSEKGARRLGALVLTSLCSVIWPDKQKYKETGEGHRLMHRLYHCSPPLNLSRDRFDLYEDPAQQSTINTAPLFFLN